MNGPPDFASTTARLKEATRLLRALHYDGNIWSAAGCDVCIFVAAADDLSEMEEQ